LSRAHSRCRAPPEPASGDAYRDFFGAHVRWNAPVTGVGVSTAQVTHPMVRANPTLMGLLENLVADLLQGVSAHDSLAQRARAELSQALADPTLSLDWLARKLHMSRTTLKRRLAAEGASYRGLLDGVRRERALRYLRDGRTSLDEVAFLLGYQDVSTLHKACQRWTGCSPKQLLGARDQAGR
jgi:AraC-like DNA-binding protein